MPFSKLSYGAYLIHVVVLWYSAGTAREAAYSNSFIVVYGDDKLSLMTKDKNSHWREAVFQQQPPVRETSFRPCVAAAATANYSAVAAAVPIFLICHPVATFYLIQRLIG